MMRRMALNSFDLETENEFKSLFAGSQGCGCVVKNQWAFGIGITSTGGKTRLCGRAGPG